MGKQRSRKKLSCQYGRFDPIVGKCQRKVEGMFKSRNVRGAGMGVPVCNLHLYALRQREAEEAGWYTVRPSEEVELD